MNEWKVSDGTISWLQFNPGQPVFHGIMIADEAMTILPPDSKEGTLITITDEHGKQYVQLRVLRRGTNKKRLK